MTFLEAIARLRRNRDLGIHSRERTPREQFLRAECDRMVGVVEAARVLVKVAFGRILMPVAVRQQVRELERRLMELDSFVVTKAPFSY